MAILLKKMLFPVFKKSSTVLAVADFQHFRMKAKADALIMFSCDKITIILGSCFLLPCLHYTLITRAVKMADLLTH